VVQAKPVADLPAKAKPEISETSPKPAAAAATPPKKSAGSSAED
jgi:hypothetical protein